MVEGWMLLALLVASPFFFILGFSFANIHVRRLAKRGGESRYPEAVIRAVEAYRSAHPTAVEGTHD